jgi:serine/threonine protein kinase
VAPRAVGPYEILSAIGRGGIGTVYRARHRETGRLAAVKVLGPAPAIDATAARRLAREFEVLRSLDHPNVIRVYEAGVTEGYSFLAMELVEGLDLRAYLSPALDQRTVRATPPREPSPAAPPTDPGTLPPVAAGPAAIRALAALLDEPETQPEGCVPREISPGVSSVSPPPPTPEMLEALNRPGRISRMRSALAQVLDALSYVHGRGFVHRDLKPSNVMVDDARRARLMDFGLVKLASERDESITLQGRVVGTYRYMSPEQAQGLPVDARSDLYSLGVIVFELVAGVPPFCAPDPARLWQEILHAPPPPLLGLNPGADPGLARLAGRLLEKDPDRRFQRADEIRAALAG